MKNFDADPERKLGKKKKTLRWLVESIPKMGAIEEHCSYVFKYREDIFRLYTMTALCFLFHSNLALCYKPELKSSEDGLNSQRSYTNCETDIAMDSLTASNKNEDYHQGMLKQHLQTKDSWNQTALVSSTSARAKDPNVTLVGAKRNVEENVEVSSRLSAKHRSRKGPFITKSNLSRRREIYEMELANRGAKQNAEKRLPERQYDLKKSVKK